MFIKNKVFLCLFLIFFFFFWRKFVISETNTQWEETEVKRAFPAGHMLRLFPLRNTMVFDCPLPTMHQQEDARSLDGRKYIPAGANQTLQITDRDNRPVGWFFFFLRNFFLLKKNHWRDSKQMCIHKITPLCICPSDGRQTHANSFLHA